MTDSTSKPAPGEIIPVEGWVLNSQHGHCGTKTGERVVRLADLVRWLMQARGMSFASAVREVCTPLEGDAPPLVYRLDPMDDAEPEDQASKWFKYFSGYEGLDSLPPQVAHARAAARDMKAAWLMKPHDLARLANSPGFPAEFDEANESPFDFSERTDRTGGPRTQAVSFAVAHELWGWGSVAAPAVGAVPASALHLADFAALVAYRKARKAANAVAGKPRKNVPWDDGNQLDVLHAEYKRLGKNTAAAESMGVALGCTRQAVENALNKEWTPVVAAPFRGLSAA